MKIVQLRDWKEFSNTLWTELRAIGHERLVTIRNFTLTTMSIDPETFAIIGDDVDRLELVKKTGTDRSEDSPFWNAPGHDYEHDLKPTGRKPNEIIYAYTASVTQAGQTVHLPDGDEEWDLADELDETQGILVYDTAKLRQVAKNEYWFKGDPRDALLFVMHLADEDD